MKKPILVIMAAGMGSRYGGLKQIDPVGKNGEIIIDYSLFDAKKAGFEKLVFIVNQNILNDFKEVIGNKMEKHFEVEYAFQQIENIPDGLSIPEGRTKPWGTGHAIMCAKNVVDAPFAVINADDFYGASGFKTIFEYLSNNNGKTKDGLLDYCMVGYILKNTLTENGHVARGVCQSNDGILTNIVERVRIEKTNDGAVFTEDDGKTYSKLDQDSIVSMNFWGFTPDIFEALESRFPDFMNNDVKARPEKAEFFLPTVVDKQLKANQAQVKVLSCNEQWYGVTYREDREAVVSAISKLQENGVYPEKLW